MSHSSSPIQKDIAIGESPNSNKKRKYSGRVKRACENCKKAKRCCDNGRPCARCTRLGIEDSCRDAERKERQDSPKPPHQEHQEPPQRELSKSLKPSEYFPKAGHYNQPTISSSDSFLSPPVLNFVEQLNNTNDFHFDPTAFEIHTNYLLYDDHHIPSILETIPKFGEKKNAYLNNYHNLIEELITFKTKAITLKKQHRMNENFSNIMIDPSEYDFIIHFLQMKKIAAEHSDFNHLSPINIFNRNETGLWILKEGDIIAWNRPAWENFGYFENDLFSIVHTWKDFVHQAEWDQMNRTVIKNWASGKTEFSESFTFVDKSGKSKSVYTTFILISQPNQGSSMPDLPHHVICFNNLL